MATYSISDLSELTGIKTHTLRVWEKRYGLLRPHRTATNIRFYDEQDLDMLRTVQRLIHNGIRISRIAEMSPDEMESESNRIFLKPGDYEEKLIQALKEMDVTRMELVLDKSVKRHGFQSTLTHLILPFLEKIEVLWLSGQIGEAHEACFRELVKRKTSREIDVMPHNCEGPRVIMFLPKGNKQELSHLVMHYFLRKHGLCVTDIGCDINLDCALSALRNCTSECVIIVNADPVHWQFGNFINELTQSTSMPILISGRASEEQLHFESEQVIVLDSIEETIQYIKGINENLSNPVS